MKSGTLERFLEAFRAECNESSPQSSIARFCRDRLLIRPKKGEPIRFVLNPVQKRYLARKRLAKKILAARGLPLRVLTLKYRRGGFTTIEQAESYKEIATKRFAHCVTLAHTRESTQEIFGIAKMFQDNDPDRPATAKVGNASRIVFPDRASKFFIGTAGGQGFGRGLTLQRVHGSEVSKWFKGPKRIERVEDLVVGLSEAASHGDMILETTPNGREWFCQTYEQSKRGQNDWATIFIPWFDDWTNTLQPGEFSEEEIRDTLLDEEKFLIERHRLGFRQLAWRRAKKRSTRLFVQEYPEDDSTCFLVTGTAYFELNTIDRLMKRLAGDSIKPRKVDGAQLWEFEPPQPGVQYVAGCDTSEGLATSDFNGVGILRKDNGQQVASLHGRLRPRQLARRAVELCQRYNGAILGIEQNNHGHAVLQAVEDVDARFARDVMRGGSLYHFNEGRPGWNTNSVTRPQMLEDLYNGIEDGTLGVRDIMLLEECKTFKKQDDGEFRADTGCYDDSVMKWAIAWQMRKVRRRTPGIRVVTMGDNHE